MTIPTRQAPPPPINQQQNRAFASSARSSVTQQRNNKSRYTPTTDWDDQPFGDMWGASTTQPQSKKPAPPRPPPPKVKPSTGKKPSTLHSNTILSNLISRARLSKPKSQPPVAAKLPAPSQPPSINYGSVKSSPSFTSSTASTPSYSADKQLISFDSPPGSPTFTQKSNSDCVSVDSFSSDSNYSPNNGFSTESGFEDDFVLDNLKPYKRMTPVDPFDLLDEPTAAARPPIAQKPLNVGSASFYTATKPVVDETLCNGKNLISAEPIRAGPTIIRAVHKKPQAPPKPKATLVTAVFEKQESDESLSESPPMPSCPPPPPPKEFFDEVKVEVARKAPAFVDGECEESYGIGLYDFDGEQDGDLPIRAGEKVYLLKRVNDEWMMGRNRRGCEGMFPVNFVEVKVPLVDDREQQAPPSGSSTPTCDVIKAKALYDFNAESSEDLTLRVNDEINILYAINEEWLFGEIGNRRGQFPANYVEYL